MKHTFLLYTPGRPPRPEQPAHALVFIIENNQSMEETNPGVLFAVFYTEMRSVIADIVGVSAEELEGLFLTEVLEDYVEPWQVPEIASSTAASGFYKEVIGFADTGATPAGLIESVRSVNNAGHGTDVLLNLHGKQENGTSFVIFHDGKYTLDEVIQAISKAGLDSQIVYQTCCDGNLMIDAWEGYGIKAVNGSIETNTYALFSPLYFIEHWQSGKTFTDAVQQARNNEIVALRTRLLAAAENNSLMTGTFNFIDFNAVSVQTTGGSTPEMKIR